MTFRPNTQAGTDRAENDIPTYDIQTAAFEVPFGVEEMDIELQKSSSVSSNKQNSRNGKINLLDSKPQGSHM